MTANTTSSLLNGLNSFRRTSQTWVATIAADTRGLGAGGSHIEQLESRTLLSAAHPATHAAATPAHTPALHAKAKTAPLVAPSAPNSLTATPLTFSSVQLNWTAGDGVVTGYIILRGTDGVHFTSLAKLTTPATSYIDKSAVSFHTYYYAVEACNGTAVSPASTPVMASTSLAAPVTFTAVATGPATVNLAWAVNEPLALGYNVLRSTDGVHYSQIAQLGVLKVGAYADTSATSNTAYSYEVQAFNGNKVSAVSTAASVTTPLKTPTALAGSFQNGAINLTWIGNDSSAIGYLVFRAGADGKTFVQIAKLTGGSTSYADSAVVSGHGYQYKVQAYAGTNTSAVSAVAIAISPLAAPTTLAAAAISANAVRLTWTDNDINALGYAVLRSLDGVHFTAIASVTGASTAAYTDATAVSGTTYTYAVTANAGTIASTPSAPATVTTPLAAPATISAIAATPTSVKLGWAITDPLATGYIVLRATAGGTYSQVTSITGKTTNSYTDAVSSATAYTYEVEAVNASNSSAASKPAAVTTPLVAPTALTATTGDGGTVHLNWTDNDSAAAGYYVLRSGNAKTYTQIANLTNVTTMSFADTSVASGHAYSYEVQAYAGANTSALSNVASVSTPLAAPSSLSVAAATAAGVQLTWTDNDVNAAGYYVLRAAAGANFTPLVALTSASANSYTDAKIVTGTTYTYEVESYTGTIVSAPSNAAGATVPLAAPTGVTATLAGAFVMLAWTDKDPAATGYNILRSTDGVTFIQLTQVTGATAKSYSDVSVTPGQTYYYQVQAYNSSVTSAVSTTATVTIPSGNVTNGVSVTSRFGDELIITAAGTSDAVSITETGTTLTIIGDGQTFTDAAPAGGTFIYTRGGSDSISVDSSVTSTLTIDSIDNAPTIINTNGTAVNAWIDSTDQLFGTATVHSVASFAGGVSKALGVALANPKDAGTTAKDNLSLFGTGPVAADVNQGEAGDCYFLSSLAAFANQKPGVLTSSAVDLGDGTYAVQFYSKGAPVYIRVNNSFTTGGFGGYTYAHPGANNTIWAAVFEKAFCYFRTGANSYASISSGWMNEVYTDLNVQSTTIALPASSDNDFFNRMSSDLASGEAVTFGTQNAPNLVHSHAYALLSVYNSGGVNYYVVRNPWGSSGDSLENSQGIATLTYAQMVANFVQGVAAMN